MNIDIRGHIINNFKDDDKNAIREAIEESIKEKDEVTLPGMGVFLELIWNNSDESDKEKLLNTLEDCIRKETAK